MTAIRELLEESRRAGVDDVPSMAAQCGPLIGASDVRIYLVDHQQTVLTAMAGLSGGSPEVLPIDATAAGSAYQTQAVVVVDLPAGDAVEVWIPLLANAVRLGVLRIYADTFDDGLRDRSAVAADLLAGLIVDAARTGDVVERVRRRHRMLVPAELIRAQLPPLTFASSRLVISGILEPCYAVGGDAFDYAVNGDIAHLALFDAVSHGAATDGLRAAVLASVALAAYRNARRANLDLGDTYRHVDVVIRDHDRAGLITGILAELDQRSGVLRVISAGHPGGFILRDGSVVTVLPTPTALPVSLGDLRSPVIVTEALRPGDQVLFYTDGITEARTEDGEFFGVPRLIDFVGQAEAARLDAAETTRRLINAILAHQNNILQDDATVLLVHWLR